MNFVVISLVMQRLLYEHSGIYLLDLKRLDQQGVDCTVEAHEMLVLLRISLLFLDIWKTHQHQLNNAIGPFTQRIWNKDLNSLIKCRQTINYCQLP